MTTDPTPDLCCTHGRKLDRAVELLEELVAARAGKPKLARGAPVKGPGTLIARNGVDCVFPFTADVVRSANPSPAIDPQAVASDSIHLSPGEAMIPGPNGLIHIRHAYGDQPAEITQLDLDDIEDEPT